MEALHLKCFGPVACNPSLSGGRKPSTFPQRKWRIHAVTRTTRPGNELSAQELFELFLRERKVRGDVITKTSDIFWKKEVLEIDEDRISEVWKSLQQPQEISERESGGGFLKLSRTKNWISANNEAPENETVSAIEWKTDRENRRRMGLLEYEALKRELFLSTIGIGAACSGYCFLVFSPQVALSYSAGAVASCLYLQLLYHHADNISKENLADVFTRKRVNKIGIRSDDLRDLFEKIARGSTLALSSPRLVIPAAIFGFWALLKHLYGYSFDFQLVPAIFGLFAYKGAALIQVYRDNEDLFTNSPDNEDLFTKSLDNDEDAES